MKSIYAGYLIRVRTLDSINSDYVNYYMNSSYAKHKCYELKTDGVSQSNINAQKLGSFDIPIPPKKEQDRIVDILNKLILEEIRAHELNLVDNQVDILKKSILAKAFRGELGTNDPNEESATELLKQVLNENVNS